MSDILLEQRKSNEYSTILDFSKEFNNITYKQFNDHILNDLYLFNVPNDEYFSQIESKLNQIMKALPAIKHILTKPIVYLKDKEEIIPVEAVKVINNQTLAHVSIHTELWGNITSEGVKPRKLMTIEKIENYAIYENIIITRVINSILKFIRRTILLMKDILYGCQDLHFNMLDRTHHKQYFLAIGKLHMEYALAHERHYLLYFSCIEKLLFIEKTLRLKLKAPMYQICNKNKSKLKLKKTNVFRSHKDYKQVFEIAKWFESELSVNNIDEHTINEGIITEEYTNYVNILLIFAISHFNFEFKRQRFNWFDLDNKCSYLNWKLNLKNVSFENIKGLKLTFKKDKEYSICIIYNNIKEIEDKELKLFKQNVICDEYLFISFETYGKKDIIYLSIYDVDSFRRLQQILLRGMLYSDEKHDVCPFCGSELKKEDGKYECDICRGEFYEQTCPTHNKKYYVSTIKKHNSVNNDAKRRFLHDRFSEAQYHFRNITPISLDGSILCPKCGQKH